LTPGRLLTIVASKQHQDSGSYEQGGAVSASNATPEAPGVYRDGKNLVVMRGAQLPLICVRCGQPATGGLLLRKLYWHERWIYLLLLPGVIWYAIAALMVRKTMDLAIPLCAQHRFRYQQLRLAAIFMMIGGGIIVIVSFFVPADYLAYPIFAFMGLLLAGLITWLTAGVFLRPKFIDTSLGVFSGPGEQFLAQLPPKPQAMPTLG
jgi:hypothetical protein